MQELNLRAACKLLRAIARLVRTIIGLATTAIQYMMIRQRPSRSLAAENLFLRKQLAMFQEREIKPRRASLSATLDGEQKPPPGTSGRAMMRRLSVGKKVDFNSEPEAAPKPARRKSSVSDVLRLQERIAPLAGSGMNPVMALALAEEQLAEEDAADKSDDADDEDAADGAEYATNYDDDLSSGVNALDLSDAQPAGGSP